MPIARPTRTARALVGALLAGTVLTACSGETAADPEPTDSVATTEAPDPAAEVVAPLLERDEVDLATLDLPEAPEGVNPAVWQNAAQMALNLAVGSTSEDLWTVDDPLELVTDVARSALPPIGPSMIDAAPEPINAAKGASLFWGPSFAPDTQPTDARVVDARWSRTTAERNGVTLDLPVVQFTTVFTFEDATPVVVQRQFKIGLERTVPDVGVFQWFVNSTTAGEDECEYWGSGTITPAETPDVEQLQTLVDNVVDQTEIDVSNDDTDFGALRNKACSAGA